MKTLLSLAILLLYASSATNATLTWSLVDGNVSYVDGDAKDTRHYPGSRRAPAYWSDEVGNALLYGGSKSSKNLWLFNATNGQWRIVRARASSERPPARRKAIMCANARRLFGESETRVLLYGGERSFGKSMRSAWIFSFANMTWKRVGVVVPDSLGLVSVQSWCDSANGVAYLFGGLADRDAMDGFWKFSFETSTFERIDIELPPRRYGGMTWMTSTGKFWLFSGQGVDSADMWVYDLFDNEWELVSDGGKESSGVYGTLNVASANNHPGCRRGGFTFVGPCGNLWLYGGTGYGASFRIGRGLLNDLWMFDVQNRTWTWMGGPQVNEGTGRLGANPWCSPRAEGATWSVGNSTLIFGGFGHDVRGDDATMNDLWRLEIVGACGEKNDGLTSPSRTVATGDRVDETTTVPPSTSRSPTVAMMPTGNDSVAERTTAPSTSPVVDNDESASAFMEHTAESTGGNDSATELTPTVGKDNATESSESSIGGTGASSENATSPPPPNDSSVETTSVESFVTSTNDDVSVGIETTSSTASVAITKSSISLKPSTSESTIYNATSAAATTISETRSESPFSTNEAKEIATVSLEATEPETIISTGASVTTVTAKPSTKTKNGNATTFSPSAVATTKVSTAASKSPTLFPGSGTPSQRSTEPGTMAEDHAEAVITNSARRPTVKTNRSSASTNPPTSIFVRTRRPTPSVWKSTAPTSTSVRTRRPTAASYSTVIPSKTRVVASTRVGGIAATSAAPSTRSSKSSELTSGPNRAEFASEPQLPDETQFEFPVRHPYPTPPQRVDAWLGSSASVPYIAICVAAFSVLLLVIAAFCGRKRRGRAEGSAVGARANRGAGRFRYQKVASEEGTEW